MDEEISAKVIDFIDRNDPQEDQQAVLRLVQPGAHARHHRAVADKYMAMVGERGGKDWGVNEAGMKQIDDNIGLVLKKIDDMGQTNNTLVVFTTDNGAETITFPDGGVTPFKGGRADRLGRRHPRSDGGALARRTSGPARVNNQMFAALDWVPTFVDIAGGAKGDGLKKQIEAGQYPGHRQDDARRRRSARLSSKARRNSARDTFFYYSGKDPSAVRYKNWKMYFAMVSSRSPAGCVTGVIPYHWTRSSNVKRDPFEQAVGIDRRPR